jgi:hypothetical protein
VLLEKGGRPADSSTQDGVKDGEMLVNRGADAPGCHEIVCANGSDALTDGTQFFAQLMVAGGFGQTTVKILVEEDEFRIERVRITVNEAPLFLQLKESAPVMNTIVPYPAKGVKL